MKKYIVTGGTGFLGRNLIRRLIEEKSLVYAIVRPDSPNIAYLPKDENVIPVYCDLQDISDHKDSIPADCDTLFHFAWGGVNRNQIDDPAVQQRNIDASVDLLKASIEKRCKCFVFAGSRSEYGIQKDSYTEDLDCNPLVAYGRAKLEFGKQGREICAGSDTVFIHPRIFSVYGPDDHPWSLVYTSVKKMLAGEEMDLSECMHYWNFMDIRDAVDLIYTLSDKRDMIPENDNGIFNVATRDLRPLKEYVEEIKSVTGSSSKLNYGAYKQSAESAVSLLPDMTKVERIFGWEPKVSFEEGIRKIISRMEEEDA